MQRLECSTAPRRGSESPGREWLAAFTLIHQAIVQHAQVWAVFRGGPIRFCPHALGWRDEEVYVQALVMQEPRDGVREGGPCAWLPRWEWLRLAELQIAVVHDGEWVTCPREQRPDLQFLTAVYYVAP